MDVKRVGSPELNQAQATGISKKSNVKGQDKLSDANGELADVSNGAEKVQWSEQATLAREATAAAKSAPDIRADRVAELKAAIRSGTYKVDAQKVADSMIQNSLEDALVTRR